ncbi:MFS transporter [Listeria monocytogenes]|nr:MFS transporter [Listeria monocytogenes]MBC1253625.1 MFS transporter [Listeria welshimeri]
MKSSMYHKVYYLASNFLNQSIIILLPILALAFFDNSDFIAKIGLFETIAGLFFGLIAIICIDYFKNKFYIVLFSTLLFTSLLSFYYFSENSMFIFMLLMVFFMLFSRLVISIQNAIMFKSFSGQEEGIEDYNKFTTSTYIIISIIAPPVTLYLYKLFGFTFILVISFVLVVSSLFFDKTKYNIDIKENIFSDLRKNISLFTSNKYIYIPILTLAIVIFSGIMVTTIYYIYIVDTLNFGNSIYTWLLTLQSIGSLIASMILYKRFFTNRISSLPILILLFALSYAVFLMAGKNILLLLLISLISGILVTLVQMLVNEQYQKNCPPDIFGTINGIRVTINNVAGLLGAGFASFAYIHIGTYGIYIVNVILLVLIALVTFKKYTIDLRRGSF